MTDRALLQDLLAGAGSGGQLIGALVVTLLYLTVGLLGAVGSIVIFGRMFTGRWEQAFWAAFLVAIAAFYLSFAAYFQAPPEVWRTEIAGVAVFLACAAFGLFFPAMIAFGYVAHALWDLSHSLYGASFAGLSLTRIPLGYGLFCLAYDVTVACYIMTRSSGWSEPGGFHPYFWRESA